MGIFVFFLECLFNFFKSEGETKEKIQSLMNETPKVMKQNKEYVVFQRYYHVFRQGELTKLLKTFPNLEVGPEVFDHANWTVICTKTSD